MLKLSAVIITLNEERNIARCIDSLAGIADDILVVDSFSTDTTEEICKGKKVRFIQHSWEGYSRQKNFGNENALFPLILSIDADEALSLELRQSILSAKQQQDFEVGEMNRLTNYCGKWVRHCGWYPDKKIRIFNREKVHWEGTIHESLVFKTKGNIQFLKGDLLHYSYYSLSDHISQVNKFTDVSAEALFKEGKKVNIVKVKWSLYTRFFQDYFLKLGILDGYTGFLICRISAHAAFLKWAKLRELHKRSS